MGDWYIFSWAETPSKFYPKDFPEWFYPNGVRMDFSNTIPTDDYTKQNYSVVPRHWFIDAYCRCEKCNQEFCWTAQEQKRWFDDLHFYVGSFPRECPDCRKKRREMKYRFQRYQTNIKNVLLRSASLESKRGMVMLINQIEIDPDNALPDSVRKKRNILEKQIVKMNND